jgi:hypothetical protein
MYAALHTHTHSLSHTHQVRALLTQNVFVSKDEKDRVNQISRAVSLACEADACLTACRRAKRSPTPEEQKVFSYFGGKCT